MAHERGARAAAVAVVPLARTGGPADTRWVAREEQRPRKKRKRRSGDPTLVGTTLAGRYHLVRLLGDGGMGAVYKAADQVLRRFVAIKLLHPATAENPAAVERFVREARSAAAIGHPNIIDILDFGYEHDRPYLVMEYLRGRSLSEAIAEEGRMTVARACNIATHSLAGLAAAHDRGILHRDLKPANMMLIALLGDSDFVKLCDFGFAALVVPTVRIDEGKTLTPARTLVGTPAYAAPERLRGDDRRDPRLDLYSLGVVLFEMLAGRRPFDAPTFRELARKVRKERPPSLRSLRRDIPKGLELVVNRALAKDRKDRWRSAEEFASALVPFGGRVIPLDDCPSDSFTMDLLRIRARETQQQKIVSVEDAEELLELRRRYREERDAKEAKLRPAPQQRPPTVPPKVSKKALGIARPSPPKVVPKPAPKPKPKPRRPKPKPAPLPQPAAFKPTRKPRADRPTSRPPPRVPPRVPERIPDVSIPDVGEGRTEVQSRPPVMPRPRRATMPPPAPPAPPAPSTESAEPLPSEPRLPAPRRDDVTQRTDTRPPVDEEYLPDETVAEHAPAPAPAAEATVTDGRWYSGSVALSVLRFVSRRFGERALTDLLATLPDGPREVFQGGVTPDQWVPYDAVNALVQHVDARLGRDDLHLVVQCGKAVAEGAFEIMRDVRPPSPPPEVLLSEMPNVLAKLIHGLHATVGRLGRGYGRVEIDERGESSLTFCVFLIGFIDRALDRFGATDVEVNLISSPALGDDTGVYEISWIS